MEAIKTTGSAYMKSASFGKRIEYYFISLMIKEGLSCFVPVADDDGVDVAIRKKDGTFIEVQVKARGTDIKHRDAAFFNIRSHSKVRDNFYFVFYSEIMDKIWVLSSQEFLDNCATNKARGNRTIKFNGMKNKMLYGLERFEKYCSKDFSRFK